MSDALVFREIRWFVEGFSHPAVQRWFEELSGDHRKSAFPRQDVYLVVPGREDLGVKVREGRFEIKIRETKGHRRLLVNGTHEGIDENWIKHQWDYQQSIAEIAIPFDYGTRVRIVKSRIQKKYDISNQAFRSVAIDSMLPAALVVETTELYSQAVRRKKKKNEEMSQPRRHWTIAFEGIGTAEQVEWALTKGVEQLLAGYDGPALREQQSYGYPRFALGVTEDLV